MNEGGMRKSPSAGRDSASSKRLDSMIEQVQDEKTKDYILNRVLPNMTYYSHMSKQYKVQYLRLMSATIILGALVPICVLFTESTLSMKILLISLSVGTMAVNMFLSLNNSKELWLNYRNTRESLESILYFYFNNAGVFQDGEQCDKNRILIERCEKELNSENGTWRSMMEK